MILTDTRYTNTDATTIPSLDDTWTYSTSSNYYKEKDNVSENELLQDELDWMRSGWFIPKKIPIKSKYLQRNINARIRNQLPYKIREITN